MVRFTPPVTLRLAPGEVLAWEQASARVRVLQGTAWITQRNDLIDYFVHHGQLFELRRGSGALIGAEQELWLRFERDAGWRSGVWAVSQRLRGWLTRRARAGATVAG